MKPKSFQVTRKQYITGRFTLYLNIFTCTSSTLIILIYNEYTRPNRKHKILLDLLVVFMYKSTTLLTVELFLHLNHEKKIYHSTG